MTPATGGTRDGRRAVLHAWLRGTRDWYGNLFGPGLLGEFSRLRAIIVSGAVSGAATGVLVALSSGRGAAWALVPALLLAGPFVAVSGIALGVAVGVLARVADTAWLRSPSRRLLRLEDRVDRLALHLERSPLNVSNIPVRDALLAAAHDEILHAEVLRRALPGSGAAVLDLSRRLARIADEEHERVLRHVESPEAFVEAGRIVDVPPGPALIRVFERRGPARTTDAYALALHVLLRRYALGRPAGGAMVLLVEAPAGFTECLALDGWLPRGAAAGPVNEDERETVVSLWDGGSSLVYTDAAELLDAARRL